MIRIWLTVKLFSFVSKSNLWNSLILYRPFSIDLFQLAGFCQPLDDRVINKIHQLVGDGVRKVSEMKRHINIYVHKELMKGMEVSEFNRRFFPLDKDIRNHIYRALVICRFVSWYRCIQQEKCLNLQLRCVFIIIRKMLTHLNSFILHKWSIQ